MVPHSMFCIQQTFVHIKLLTRFPQRGQSFHSKKSQLGRGCCKLAWTLGPKPCKEQKLAILLLSGVGHNRERGQWQGIWERTALQKKVLLLVFEANGRGQSCLGFPSGSGVKNLPAMQERQLPSLGQEDALEKEMATYSSILAWEISWTEELGGLQPIGQQRVRHDWSDLACK